MRTVLSERIILWTGGTEDVDLPEGKGVGGYHQYSQEVFSEVSAYGLLQTSDVTPGGVAVPHAIRHEGRRIHGSCGGGSGKQVSAKTDGTGKHIREAE